MALLPRTFYIFDKKASGGLLQRVTHLFQSSDEVSNRIRHCWFNLQ